MGIAIDQRYAGPGIAAGAGQGDIDFIGRPFGFAVGGIDIERAVQPVRQRRGHRAFVIGVLHLLEGLQQGGRRVGATFFFHLRMRFDLRGVVERDAGNGK